MISSIIFTIIISVYLLLLQLGYPEDSMSL